jgi:hypothetical protein
MSTRCQILFKFEDGQVLTYRHSDGYATGVLPDLVEFLKWNEGRNNQSDYVVPNYFYWSKKHSEEYMDYDYKTGKIKRKKTPIHKRKMGGNEAVLIGYGLDYQGTFHGDIEYFYTVEFFDKNTDSFHPEMEFRIRAYKPVFKKGGGCFDLEYEYPEQLIRNEKPFIELNITDLKNYQVISDEEIEKIETRLREEIESKCNHEFTDYYIDGTKTPNVKHVYCKDCTKTFEDQPI